METATVVERPQLVQSPSTPVEEDLHEEPEPFGSELSTEATTANVGGGDHRTQPMDVPPEEAHVREVFAEYLAARRQCGEPTASLTLEKFRAKLDANRQQLIAKYGCRTARFAVYIKDGKAGIKATPVRD
jgi:hypothetical protein